MPVTIITSTVNKAIADSRPGGPRYDVVDAKSKGLSLRVSPKGVQWSLRFQIAGRDKRLALGTVDQWSISEARELAARAQAMLRDRMGIPDETWLDAYRRRAGKVAAVTMVPAANEKPRDVFKWTFAQARDAYLADRAKALRPLTVADYRMKLTAPELAPFDKTPVSRITRQDMAGAVAKVHRSGRETHATNLVRAITAFWSWLERDEWIGKSGVTAGVMRGLRAPDRTIDDEDEEDAFVPELLEVGRVIAIARSGAMHPTVGSAIELMAWTVQRRRTIAEARAADFEPVGDGKQALWIIPPKSLKKRLRNGRKRRPHVIPLPPPAWALVMAQLARIEKEDVYLFPQVRARRAGDELTHISPNSLSHATRFMPGIKATPHALRRAFATHGESKLGLLRADTRAILDHAEGAGDVTGGHYALHDKTHRTWPIMDAWTVALLPEIERASVALEPVAELKAAMAAAKRGDGEEQLQAAE